MAGRKRVPSHLKLIRGTARPDRTNEREPVPASGRPRRPGYLSPKSKRFWDWLCDRMDSMGTLTKADRAIIELAAAAYGEWRDAMKVIETEGATYVSRGASGTMVRPHPAVAQRADAWRRLASALASLGMTPADRSKVSTLETDSGDAWSARG